MKELWNKHKKLLKFAITLCVIILAIGVIEVVSIIQETKREATAGDTMNLYQNTTSFHAYDVTGLTDEEIDYYLELQRQTYQNQEDE